MDPINAGLHNFRLGVPFDVKVGDRLGIVPEDNTAIDCASKTKYSPADLQVSGDFSSDIDSIISGLTRRPNQRFKVSFIETVGALSEITDGIMYEFVSLS